MPGSRRRLAPPASSAAREPPERAPGRPSPSVGWLEQTSPGQFRLHSLEKGKLTHVTLDVADYDGDGDLDLLVSSFAGFTFATADTGYKADSWVELLENKATHPAAPAPTK